jgi:hypothetical protein
MSRKIDKGRLPAFVPMFKHTTNSKAYMALSVGARAALFELTSMYNGKSQNAVFLSSRNGAKRLGACKDTVCKWLRELEHYGFIAVVRRAHLGVEGVGKATCIGSLTEALLGNQRPGNLMLGTAFYSILKNKTLSEKLGHPVRKSRT